MLATLTLRRTSWFVGNARHYRVDIYNGGELATSVKFTIKAGKAQGDEPSDDSSDE